MNESLLEDLWIGAFRYYCGRQTIAVHSFANGLIKAIDKGQLPERAHMVIKRDLIELINDDDKDRENGRWYKTLGDDVDRALWLKVLAALSGM